MKVIQRNNVLQPRHFTTGLLQQEIASTRFSQYINHLLTHLFVLQTTDRRMEGTFMIKAYVVELAFMGMS